MTLTSGKLILAKDYFADDDARAYVAAVESADGQSLEPAVVAAYDNFIVGCKADGIWDAIKASCILAGARTLSGALVPLVGTAPTNNGPFVSADYNRKTGLVGDGSTKYLNTNRSCSLELQNNVHGAVYANTRDFSAGRYLGSAIGISFELLGNSTGFRARVNDTTLSTLGTSTSSNVLIGVSRSSATAYSWRDGTQSGTQNNNSSGVASGNYFVFSGLNGYFPTDARIAFYSIGSNLDLALLDTRVSTLISDLGAAI